MVDLNMEVCLCNSVTFKELIECIKEHGIQTVEELIENNICPVGNKCESCIDEGYNNDGINLPLALSLAQKNN